MTPESWEKSEAIKPLTDFRKTIMDLDAHLRSIAQSGNEQDILDALVLAHAIKTEIGYVFSDYQGAITEHIPSSECQASNGQVIEKKMGNDRKAWQHDRLADEVLRRLNEMSVDMDTGEVVMTSKEIAMKLFDYVAPSYWRVKELSKLGINADQYCDVGELKTSIIIRKVDK
jgi:hypothetical protein